MICMHHSKVLVTVQPYNGASYGKHAVRFYECRGLNCYKFYSIICFRTMFDNNTYKIQIL